MSKRERSRTGEVINGEYSLEMLSRSEGVCEAYLATDQTSGQPVTVKVLKPEFALNPNVAQEFLNTPKSLSRFKHPNLPQVLKVDLDETGIPFVVEEHVEGTPLSNELERFGNGMPLGPAFDLIVQMLTAVAAAHERGVVHGRLNPRAVILERQGSRRVVRVLGFCGASAAADAIKGSWDGVAAGNLLAYIAPEARMVPARIDTRSDVWSLGVLVYELLSGRSPFPPHAGATAGIETRQLQEVAPDVPRHMCTTVNACLSVSPASRPKDAADLRDRLMSPPARTSQPPRPGSERLSQKPLAMRTSSPGRLPPERVDPLAATLAGDMHWKGPPTKPEDE